MASLVLFLAASPLLRADDEAALRQVQVIRLDDVHGRIDHLALDPVRHRLYVAALGNNTVEVIDLQAGARVARILNVPEAQGILWLPESQRLVVTSGGAGECRSYDSSMKLLGSVGSLDDADNVRFDAKRGRLLVAYGGGAIGVIDPDGMRKLAEISLSGHPESLQLDADGKRVFINVPGAGHVAVADVDSNTVVATWPIEAARANYPMALDSAHQRLFVGCRRPAKLVVMDATSGRSVADLECCGDADDVFYDDARKRVYLSGGEGCISVFQQSAPDRYELLQTIPTAKGARTCLFVPETATLYLAVPRSGDRAAEIRVFRASPP